MLNSVGNAGPEAWGARIAQAVRPRIRRRRNRRTGPLPAPTRRRERDSAGAPGKPARPADERHRDRHDGDIAANRMLLRQMSIAPGDLLPSPPDAPTFAEYVPQVRARLSEGTLRTYNTHLTLPENEWPDRRLLHAWRCSSLAHPADPRRVRRPAGPLRSTHRRPDTQRFRHQRPGLLADVNHGAGPISSESSPGRGRCRRTSGPSRVARSLIQRAPHLRSPTGRRPRTRGRPAPARRG